MKRELLEKVCHTVLYCEDTELLANALEIDEDNRDILEYSIEEIAEINSELVR